MCDFPVPGLPISKAFFASGDERQRMQLEAARARQLWIERPIKLRQRRLFLKARLLIAAIDQTRLTTIHFILQNQTERLQKWLVGTLGLHHAGFCSVSAHPRQAQSSQAAGSISGIVIVSGGTALL